jgi:hypothetical protein
MLSLALTSAARGEEPSSKPLHDQLHDLWRRVDLLKEDIRRSHARLGNLAADLELGEGAAHATVQLENKMSGMFRVERALVMMDGAVQLNSDAPRVLAQATIPVFDANLPSGDHVVRVVVKLRGHGFGVFSYLNRYRFELRGSTAFTAVEGRTTSVRVRLYEKGNTLTPIEEKPAIRFIERISDGLADVGPRP